MKIKYFFRIMIVLFFFSFGGNNNAYSFSKNSTVSKLKINYKVTNLPASKDAIKVDLVAYKGKSTTIMATATIAPGKDNCVLIVDKEFHEGIMDIKIGEYASSIVVLKNTTQLDIEDSIENLAANKVNLFNDEQKALAFFKEAYLKLNNQDDIAKAIMQVETKSNPTSNQPFLDYLKTLYIDRLTMNQAITALQANFPNTFIASAVPSFMIFPELKPDEKLNFTYFHNNYFKNWNFKNQNIIYTPMVTFEVTNYLTTFGATNKSDKWYDGIEVFFTTVDKSFDADVKDFFSEFLIVEFMQSKDPEGELYMQYIYNSFIAGCSENLSKDRFMKSLANIDSVKEGAKAPDINILDKNNTNKNLYHSLNEYTMVFLWKPHCPYCESLLPTFKDIAKKYNKNVTVFAVSLDKNEAEWQQIIKDNQVIKNWIDVSDHKGFESPSLKNYFYKATPTVFLLDKNGIIISKSVDPKVLESIITKKV